MPTRPPRACARCRGLVPAGEPCPTCRADNDRERPNSHQRHYDAAHRGFRKAVLDRDPLCVLCGRVSNHADHHPRLKREIEAAGEDPNDPAYGRGLCHACHSKATAEDERTRGGWNR